MKILSDLRAKHDAKHSAKGSVPIYLVFRLGPGDLPFGSPVYYAASKSAAVDYVSRLAQLEHSAHYASWCRLHNADPGFPSDSWDEYLSASLEDDDSFAPYGIQKTCFSLDNVATFIRMLCGSVPAFLPSEPDEEIEAYLSSSPDEARALARKACEADPACVERVNRIILDAARLKDALDERQKTPDA